MAKKVTFNDLDDNEGTADRRMDLEEVAEKPAYAPEADEPKAEEEAVKEDPAMAEAVPAQEPNAQEKALAQLDALHAFFGNQKAETLSNDHKINQIHILLVKEMGQKRSAGKELHFSDGNLEVISLMHGKLIEKKNA